MIEVRNRLEARVVDTPRIGSMARAAARYRSIVAADIPNSSARTAGRYRFSPSASSPCRSKAFSSAPIDAARYLPHSPPEVAQTRRNITRASSEYFGDRGLRGDRTTAFPAPFGVGFAAADRRHRPLSRDHPVTATTSSSNRPLSFFDALAYSRAYFLVISALDAIDNPIPIPAEAHASRAFLT